MRRWYIILPLSLIVVSVFAAFSWFVVEKRSLALRKYLRPIEERIRSLFSASWLRSAQEG